jgi:lysozyme
VQEGMEWTEEQAEESLKEEVISYCRYVEELVKVPLNQNQFDALTSWTYNLGPTNLKSSTMLKVLNDGNYDEVPEQIKKWNKAGGQVLNGLIKRRDAEAELFVS